ncbi:MAG: proteasome subunit alpha, partial [Acidimicrobiales bacterium]
LVAEVGVGGQSNQLYHILYDGSMADEGRFCVLGGDADAISDRLKVAWQSGWTLTEALRAAVGALAGDSRTLGAGELEVAVLDSTQARRAFRRIVDAELEAALGA